MDHTGHKSGHLMLITPERVFYAGLLGRPRQRCSGGFNISYVDGTNALGDYAKETFNIGGTTVTDLEFAVLSRPVYRMG